MNPKLQWNCGFPDTFGSAFFLSMGCQQSIPIEPIQYKSTLPNTMDAEHGLVVFI